MMDDARPIPPLERHYGALATHLAAQRGLGLAQCTLSFGAIETVVGRPLPRTARHPRRYRPWWYGYGAGFPHVWYGWQRAGWTVAAVDLARPRHVRSDTYLHRDWQLRSLTSR